MKLGRSMLRKGKLFNGFYLECKFIYFSFLISWGTLASEKKKIKSSPMKQGKRKATQEELSAEHRLITDKRVGKRSRDDALTSRIVPKNNSVLYHIDENKWKQKK
jgi:hypothetical protein